VFRGFQSRWI